jgi:preprotein translocase subunit SecE
MAESNSLVERVRQWPGSVKSYFQDLQMEMRRVTWPTRKQVQATTVVVIATVFGFAAYFAVVDTVFSRTIGQLFETLSGQ